MFSNIPHISYAMLVDALWHYQILAEPVRKPKRFGWASSLHWTKNGSPVPEKDMLFVCEASAAPKAASLHPGQLLIVIASADESGPLSEIDSPLLVVERDARTDGLLQGLQDRFLGYGLWKSDIQSIAPSPDSFRQILNKSARIIGAPLLLYGNDLKPTARALFNINRPFCQHFQSREQEILNSVRAHQGGTLVFKTANDDLIVESRRIGSEKHGDFYLIALFELASTQGKRDLLDVIATALENRADLPTDHFEPAKYSSYRLFDDLFNGRYISQGQLSDYSLNNGFPLDAEYRLICFAPFKDDDLTDLDSLALSLRAINGGKNIPVVHDSHLYLLFWSKGLDNSLSNSVIERQLLDHLDPRMGFVAVSQVFDDVTSLRFAYEQIKLVAKYRRRMDLVSWLTLTNQEESSLCYTFEEALRFAIVDTDAMTPELRDFSFSHTILDKLIAEDAENGSNDARILASYLQYERKATVVADKLHVHRNTVLYRIEKIEKRFGVNLDESWTRERLLFDFSILYSKLANDPELVSKLFGNDREAIKRFAR